MDRESADYRLPDLASTGWSRSALNFHQWTLVFIFYSFYYKKGETYSLQCIPHYYNVSSYYLVPLDSCSPLWSSRHSHNWPQDVFANPRSSSGRDPFNRPLRFRSYATSFFYSLSLIYFSVHYYMNARNGDFAVSQPLVLGHEAAGIVTAVGQGVNNFKIGDRIAIEAGIYCRNCNFCDKGRYNLCKEMKFCSSAAVYPHVDGTLQTKMNHPIHVLHQYVSFSPSFRWWSLNQGVFSLPDTCSFDQASLAEPLSVVIHASRRCGLAPSQTVLVYGVGAIGLLACALAKHTGASKVCAIDINPARLEFAMKHGFADAVYCLPSSTVPSTTPRSNGVSINGISKPSTFSDEQIKRSKDAATAALTAFDSKDGFDIVFECTGAEGPIQMCIFVSIFRSIIVLVFSVPSTIHSPKHTYPTDSNNWWTSHAYWNGYTRSPPPTFNSSSSWSRHSRFIPIRWYLSGSSCSPIISIKIENDGR